MYNSIVEAIFKHAEKTPDKIAVVSKEEITYVNLAKRIKSRANILTKANVKAGNKVMLATNYDMSFIETYFAIHMLGATSVVVEENANIESVRHILEEIKPHHIFLNGEGESSYSNLDEIKIDNECFDHNVVKVNAPADILYTTGTTGTPKGVVLSHKNELAGARNVINGGEMRETDVNLLTMPLHHAYGLTTLRSILYCGGTVVLQKGIASLKSLLNNLREYKCNAVYMVPSAINILQVATKNNLSLLFSKIDKLELCTAPVDAVMRRSLFRQLSGVRLYNSYGATEAARTIYLRMDIHQDKLTAIGRAVEGVEIVIVDNDGNEIQSSRENPGRIAIKSEVVMEGYYGDKNMTDLVLKKGMFLSGDIGYKDEAGFVYLLGRCNDIINVGGEKVSPIEIENAILECEGILECACVSVEDKETLGNVPIAFVVMDKNFSWDEKKLKTELKGKLENFKIPSVIIKIDAIPKNHVGKINRLKLMEMLEA